MRWHALLSALSKTPLRHTARGSGDPLLTTVTDDSRKIEPGNVFVAYRGLALDGHRFVAEAVRRGAAALVVERADALPEGDLPALVVDNGREALAWLSAAWRGFPGRALRIAGVTGTDGKTTTSNLAYRMLDAAGLRTGLISTVNAVIGTRVLDTGLHTTTPDADETQDYLAQMRDAGLTHCVLEVTSHALAHHRVDGTPFAVAAVTNITHDHLDLHGSREASRAAKARLFEMAEAAVLNADDVFSFDALRACATGKPTLTYSVRGKADLTARAITRTPQSMRVQAETPLGALSLETALIGDYNVSNLLAATGIAITLGVPAAAIEAGAAALRGIPGRMERIDAGQPYLAVVDFAHTPNALENCLRTLRTITPGRLIAVFGCAGERDREKRPLMGRAAATLADVVVMTAEDPRREPIESILDAMVAGARTAGGHAQVLRVPDRGDAIRTACALARPGDTVVACGKGHEQSMCYGTVETPWDDRVAMRAAITA